MRNRTLSSSAPRRIVLHIYLDIALRQLAHLAELTVDDDSVLDDVAGERLAGYEDVIEPFSVEYNEVPVQVDHPHL